MGSNNNRQYADHIRFARHTLTAADTEIPIAVFQENGVQIVRVSLIPNADVASTTSNGLAFHIINETTAMAGNTTIASYTLGTLAAATLTKGYKYEATLSSTAANCQVDADEVMTFYQKTIGSGVASAGFLVDIEYIIL